MSKISYLYLKTSNSNTCCFIFLYFITLGYEWSLRNDFFHLYFYPQSNKLLEAIDVALVFSCVQDSFVEMGGMKTLTAFLDVIDIPFVFSCVQDSFVEMGRMKTLTALLHSSEPRTNYLTPLMSLLFSLYSG